MAFSQEMQVSESSSVQEASELDRMLIAGGGEGSRGVKIGGQGAAALVAKVVAQACELAAEVALLPAPFKLDLQQLQQKLLRLNARHLHSILRHVKEGQNKSTLTVYKIVSTECRQKPS